MRKAKLGRCKELAPNWQGGISNLYPTNFNEEYKAIIRRRDNWKCRMCNKTEKENGRALDIHHIDYNKENLSPNNLVSLCHKCHMKTNGNKEYWESYFKNMEVNYARN